MTGHVVFGEGRNDVYFMQKILDRVNVDTEIRTFYAEDLEDQNPSPGEEENALREFRREDDCEHFVKSEGSDNNLYKIFAYSCEKIISEQFDCTLVADLDHDGIENLVSDVQDALDEEFGGPVQWQEQNFLCEAGDLQIWSVTLEDTALSVSTEIHLVTFDNDVEAAVGCSSGDERAERFPLIREYAEERQTVEAFLDLYR